MTTGLTNPIAYTPLSSPSRARILTAVYSTGAAAGGVRSLPADLGTSQPSGRVRPSAVKEHPTSASSSLPVLAPAQSPVQGLSDGPSPE